MRNAIFAIILAAGAVALAAPAGAATKCDSNGCWTVNCDASGNHCHRHWLDDHRASQARYDQTAPVDAPRPKPADCTPDGDCR